MFFVSKPSGSGFLLQTDRWGMELGRAAAFADHFHIDSSMVACHEHINFAFMPLLKPVNSHSILSEIRRYTITTRQACTGMKNKEN